MKKSILFVDDEPFVLNGLKRMLRGMRSDWEMIFSDNACEALTIMGKKPFDVVVADLLMPQMNGVEFLDQVKKIYPQTIRIVLSGHTKDSTILKSVKFAHQYLSKPCDVAMLKGTIAHALTYGEILFDDINKGAVGDIEKIPSMPALYSDLITEIQSKDASVKKISTIISQDIGMSVKVLQLVNSAFFGLPQHISNATQAVMLLGIDTVKALVLTAKIFSLFKKPEKTRFSFDSLWKHSIFVGNCAREIARKEGFSEEVIGNCFIAGLIHDVGKLVFSSRFPEKYDAAMAFSDTNTVPIWEAEDKIFESNHSLMGGCLVGIWGLPQSLAEAVLYHHQPSSCPDQSKSVLTVVHVADRLVYEKTDGNEGDSLIDNKYLDRLGITLRIPLWRECAHSIINKGLKSKDS